VLLACKRGNGSGHISDGSGLLVYAWLTPVSQLAKELNLFAYQVAPSNPARHGAVLVAVALLRAGG
jgi:hypothetical protein